ncbi:uncharacterized protein LOC121992574 [Zingiber officinale]|uniref:Uncharacterized protein n=1 Tax=Zingiber officinale TaxID=94328 RepID=A0A8J5G4R9_ZINOF|nr:uncharacterized protein LOC121992574 [Zingiber officinale]KAG6495919.1 hypothetical protein ZIOFF_043752 [Zingiber officinale]
MLSLPISGGPPFTSYVSSASRASRSRILQSRQQANMVLWISKKQRLLAFVNANTSQGKGSFDDPVIMVDPVEAKRLAAKQMQEIKAKEKLKRRRQAEAINGTLAMIGLTAGLVIEGQTGKGLLGQLAGYLAAFISLFIQ